MRLVEAGWDADVAPPPPRPAHHRGDASSMSKTASPRCIWARCSPTTERRYLTCDATCEVWFHRDGQPIGAGRATRADQPPASSRPRAPPPHVRGARLRRHPRSARPPHPALGRRRPHRIGQPGAGLPLPPPAAPPRHHHHHRTRRPARRHRQRGPTTQPRHHSPVHRPNPRRPCRPTEDPPANAPTGGGTNPSNPNHHRQTTRSNQPDTPGR